MFGSDTEHKTADRQDGQDESRAGDSEVRRREVLKTASVGVLPVPAVVGTGEQTSTLTVTKSGAPDGYVGVFVVSAAGLRPNSAADGDVEGTTTGATAALDWLGPARGTDSYTLDARPETLLVMGPATARWNGRRVAPSSLSGGGRPAAGRLLRRLRVESTGGGIGFYGVSTTSGTAPAGNAEPETDGANAVDWVGPARGVDEFRFAGDISAFITSGNITVTVDGASRDPGLL